MKEASGQLDFGFNGYDHRDGAESKRRKQAGMDLVKANNAIWTARANLLLHFSIPPGWRGLPEDWRGLVTDTLGPPTNHHAWGPLTKSVLDDGLIRRSGRRCQMKAKKSHARMTDEYERPTT